MCDFIIDVMSDMKSVIATKDISRKQADVSIREKSLLGAYSVLLVMKWQLSFIRHMRRIENCRIIKFKNYIFIFRLCSLFFSIQQKQFCTIDCQCQDNV